MNNKFTKVLSTILFLSATSLVSQANAGVISASEFTGELYEGFEANQSPGFSSASFFGFENQATFSLTGSGFYHTTSSWSGGECGCVSGVVEGS
ncbi:hypothetical protein [Aliiglaciecola lipolytica]|uniref:Uncharacterized protein n=1 Tax=Aliiglaciecola lipolytica E3 TaxID=1127673 RepID=K6X1Y6_9ALTE|nr:hypothetical protein [Aliiglaciecola lipolytica]GAC14674.1 hypothetical protein GLIP_2046 [Aliiglaciecola lipolytica E3]